MADEAKKNNSAPANQDAEVRVAVSKDRMEAVVTVLPARGAGTPALAAGLRQRLASSGVKFGIDEKALEEAAQRSSRGGNEFSVVAARGREVVHGEGARLEMLVNLDETVALLDGAEQEPPGEEEGEGRTDYHFPAPIPAVEAGQVIAVVHPAIPGEPGRTVLDEPIEPKAEGDELPKVAARVQLVEKDDGTQHYVASEAGKVQIEGKRMMVVTEHIVQEDASVRRGDVIFPCDVVVKGNVLENAVVRAGGNITVMGRVDAATLEAGGSISVSKGIVGGGRGVVRAARDITANFCEGANLEARGGINIARGIMNSDVSTSGSVSCLQGRGALIGGVIRAGQYVEAKNIGTETSGETHLVVGTDFLKLKERDQIVRDASECADLLQKLDHVLGPLDAGPDLSKFPEDKRETARKAIQERLRQRAALKSLQGRLKAIDEEMESAGGGAVRVVGAAHPGVRVTIRHCQAVLTEEVRYAQLVENPETGSIGTAPL